jgi:hypothetical protein
VDLKGTTGHKYQIGRKVRFTPAMLQKTASAREPYVIVRLLPGEGGGPQYHIKHVADDLQRVVLEGQISPFDPPLDVDSQAANTSVQQGEQEWL